jgi:hypothetical protein
MVIGRACATLACSRVRSIPAQMTAAMLFWGGRRPLLVFEAGEFFVLGHTCSHTNTIHLALSAMFVVVLGSEMSIVCTGYFVEVFGRRSL